ncbi:hypothetical protein [uncultured Megasphaera sp.]|uniref:hypothetical protein n=1 Tax=uncultured Megasphaera sp. TaxID=165188 RepID=UPI00266D9BD0|nr:hypothetical protein [uncultured Megasphaera sp.]
MIHAKPSVFVRKLEERYCQIVKRLAVYHYERTKCRDLEQYASRLAGFAVQDRKEKLK